MLFIKELLKQSDILKAKQNIKDKDRANTLQGQDGQRIKIKRGRARQKESSLRLKSTNEAITMVTTK